jgi:OTU domain-containing protein 5
VRSSSPPAWDDRSGGMVRNATSGGVEDSGWRSSLRSGLWLDVADSVSKWSEAEVLQVSETQIHITYIYWQAKWDEWIDKTSERLAPYGTRIYLENGVLHTGHRIEVLDTVKKWCEAAVIQEEPTKVFVHYLGWHQKYDEWIPRAHDGRVSPYGRHLKKHMHKQISKRKALQATTQERSRQMNATDPRYDRYREALQTRQLSIFVVEGDGNCLFRSVSRQVYGDDSFHALVRSKCMDYMQMEAEYFQPYVLGDMNDFLRYVEAKRMDGVWGDDPEIQAVCELYDRPAEIWAYDRIQGAQKLSTFHESGLNAHKPMRISYYGGGHYNSVEGPDFEANLNLSPPGELEMSRMRQRISRTESATQEASGEATAEDDLANAIKASRDTFDGHFTSLEDAYEASLKQYAAAEASEIDASCIEQAKEDSDLLAMQEQIAQQAVEQSEQDQLDVALKASQQSMPAAFAAPSNVAFVEFEEQDELAMLQQALATSLGTNSRAPSADLLPAEDPELAAAVEASMADRGMVFSEDEELSRALAFSMQDR